MRSCVRAALSELVRYYSRENSPVCCHRIRWAKRPYPFAAAKPRNTVRPKNIVSLPAEIQGEAHPFVEEASGIVHRSVPFSGCHLEWISDLEGCPCVGVGPWNV
jgi:hypothetical protein